MRQYFLGLLILFFTSLNTPVLAGWTEVGNNDKGSKFYVDFERVRKLDGYLYFWALLDFPKPTDSGHFSISVYMEVDCRKFRMASLSYHSFEQPMGGGNPSVFNPKEKEWHYPRPNSGRENIIQAVCDK